MTEHSKSAEAQDFEAGQVADVVAADIGTTLRRAREALNMQIEQAARQLHLDVRLLTALESDDFAALPGTAYAYGYLRSYAKLLKIPDKELLQQFMDMSQKDSNALVPNHMTFAVDNKVASFSFAQILLIVFVVLLILGGAAWLLMGDVLKTSAEKVSAVKVEREVAKIPVELPEKPTPKVAEKTAGVIVQKEASLPQSIEVKHVESVSTPKSIKMLRLAYEKNSWTEVRDAHGETLIYRMVNAGEKLTLQGQPPYTILLGYAPGVTVTYKDSIFDTKPYRRNDIAYFRIGKKSSVVATEE